MTTNFPTSLDTLVNPIASDDTSVVSHADQHANANDAIEALQDKVGANSSSVTTSHDYKIAQLESDSHTHSNKAVLDATTASFTTADETKLAGIATGATVNDTDANLLNRANHTGTQTASTISDFDTEVANNTTVAANTAKLAGIESGATADQTASEIKVAYESNANTNAFTDAEKTLLGNQSGTNTGDQDLSGYVQSVTAGTNVTIDNTDPQNPVVSSTATSGASAIDDLTDVTITSPSLNQVLKYDGSTWINDTDSTGGGGVSDGDKGDITVSGTGAVWTIDDEAVTFAKMQHISQNHFLGRDNSGSGDVEALSATQARDAMGLGTAATTDSTDYATAAQGALADTALQSYTETDPVVGAVSGIVKSDGAGNISAATPGTDYAEASHTHTASQITDFDTEVSNNSSVVANTAKVGVTTEISNVVEDTTPQLGGDLDAQSNDLNTVGDIDYTTSQATISALGNLGASQVIDWSTATHFTGTLDSNVTITHSNETSGQSITLYLSYSGAQRTITWSDVDTWLDSVDGSAPAAPITTGDVLVVTLQFIGTTCYASATGNYAVY